jgi:hypothetical protein
MDKDFIIEQLIQNGIFKLDDGRQLYELSVPELEQLLSEVNTDEY